MLTIGEGTKTGIVNNKKFSTKTFFKKPEYVNYVPPSRKIEVVLYNRHIEGQLA